jgi:hypothetical protein
LKLEDVTAPALDLLIEDLSDLRHDLGKYVTFEVRFLGSDPNTEDLRAALQADVLRTHKRGEEVATAWQVWERLRPRILDGDEDIVRIEENLEALQALDLSGSREILDQAAGRAQAIAQACRSLHRRACSLE